MRKFIFNILVLVITILVSPFVWLFGGQVRITKKDGTTLTLR